MVIHPGTSTRKVYPSWPPWRPRRAEEFKEMTARTFLSRRSLGEGGCSMRITEDVRKFAAEQKLSEEEALRAAWNKKRC